MLSDRCLSCLSSPVCDVGVLWPNGWTDQDETWHAGRPRPQPHCVRDEISSSPTERGITAPTFEIYGRRLCLRPYNPRPMSILTKTVGWKMPRGREISLRPGDIVLDGDPAPTPLFQKGHSPQFSVHKYCGQTVADLSCC